MEVDTTPKVEVEVEDTTPKVEADMVEDTAAREATAKVDTTKVVDTVVVAEVCELTFGNKKI